MLARCARLTRPKDEGLGLGMRIGAALRGDRDGGTGKRLYWEENWLGGRREGRWYDDAATADYYVNIRALDPDGFSDERHS